MSDQLKSWGYYALGSAVFSGAMMLSDFTQRDRVNRQQLAAAVAEADRLLPGGWRWDDLQKRRRMIPPSQNSARHLPELAKQIPGRWPGEDVDKALSELQPQHRLSREDLLRLQLRLGDVKQALHTARGFLDRPDGRFPINWKLEFLDTLLNDVQDVRTVVYLLSAAAIARAEAGDGDQALADCRAIPVMASWLRDEPTMIVQLVRIAISAIAANTVERVLAQTEPSPAALAALQKLLAEDLAGPAPIQAGVDGELALMYRWLEAVRAGKARFGYGGPIKPVVGPLEELFTVRYFLPSGEAKLVRALAQMAAALRKPFPEQRADLKRLEKEWSDYEIQVRIRGRANSELKAEAVERFGDVFVGLLLPAIQKVNEASLRHLASQRTLMAALAAERFRRGTGRWPEKFGELVPKYLSAAPTDPYDGQPLRLKRTSDGLVIYSVGPDRKDNGGIIDRQRPTAPGTDYGYRLWDVPKRRQPPLPPKPKSEDQP